MVWAVFAVLTAFAALAVLIPLSRASRRETGSRDASVALYADQLQEIDRDLARGTLAPAEAGAARAEVGRRLLAASRQSADARPESAWRGRLVTLVAIVVLPLAAVAGYLATGAPDTPDRPLAARDDGTVDGRNLDGLIARVERHLAETPDDGQGWAVLAPVYLRTGRAADAAAAYRNAIRLVGADAEREAGLGEALTALGGGIVTADARAAFERAAALDPTAVKPQFYLALALGQEGRRDEAAAAWRALIAGAPPGAPWLSAAQAELAGVDPTAAPPAAAPGPSAADVEAAGTMSQGDRAAMIEGMVKRLAERLAAGGGSLDEWLRLANAYAVLGRPDDARAALLSAKAAFPDDAAAGKRIDEAATALNLSLKNL